MTSAGNPLTEEQLQGSRKCPQCAELVKAEAFRCRFCGFRLRPVTSNSDFTLSRRAGFFLIAGAILVTILIPVRERIFDLFRSKPVAVDLAELERQFGEDTPAALAAWRNRPILVSATLASSKGTDLALDSIYVMAVHAKLNSPFSGTEGQPVRLHCRDVEEGGLIGGKPQLLNCNAVR